MEVTRTLARFVIEHRSSDVPESVRHEAARSFLNWVGGPGDRPVRPLPEQIRAVVERLVRSAT